MYCSAIDRKTQETVRVKRQVKTRERIRFSYRCNLYPTEGLKKLEMNLRQINSIKSSHLRNVQRMSLLVPFCALSNAG